MVKRVKKRKALPRTPLRKRKQETKEKIIVIMFLVFVILAIMVLFRGAPTPMQKIPASGAAIATSHLTESSYNKNAEFNGSVKLQLQEGDILPPDTEIDFLVYTNKPKCSKYLCQNNIPLDWYAYDETTEQCYLKDADPEGKCCMIMGPQCKQIILNSEFEAISNEFPISWSPYVMGLGGNAVGTENYQIDYLGNYSNVAYTDTGSVAMGSQGIAAFHQDLSNRQAKISDFRTGVPPIDEPSQVQYLTDKEETKFENELSFDSSGLSYQALTHYETLTWKVQYDKQYYYTGCAFELVIKSAQGRSLHYWYTVNASVPACQRPADTATDKYVQKVLPTEANWSDESADLYADWVSKEWPITDTLKEIWIVSHGVYLSNAWSPNSQRVRWDDIKLTKTGWLGTPLNLCEARGQRCCAEGTGFGSYFKNLECTEGKECWSNCADSRALTLVQFIQLSTTNNKKNMTSGLFTYIKDPSEQTEEETNSIPPRCSDSECILGYDYGSGYTACLDTSEDAPHSCEDWDNTYELPLDDLTHFKTPKENGTYELVVKIQYKPKQGNCGQILDPETYQYKNIDTCLMYEVREPFTVGEVCEPTWQCTSWTPYPCTDKQTRNCTDVSCGLGTKTEERTCCSENWQCSQWSDCVNGVRTRTCTDLNNCSTTYELNDTWQDPACAALPACTASDWSCTDWQPVICPKEGYQTRTCDLIGNCDTTTGYIPEETRECTPEEKPSLGWLIYVLIGIIVVAAIIFALKFVMKKKPTKKAYPELTSYIRDALAAGATRAEIRAKLLEAGWPKNAIEKAIKSVK